MGSLFLFYLLVNKSIFHCGILFLAGGKTPKKEEKTPIKEKSSAKKKRHTDSKDVGSIKKKKPRSMDNV